MEENVGYSEIESISVFSPQADPNDTLCPENDEDFLLNNNRKIKNQEPLSMIFCTY